MKITRIFEILKNILPYGRYSSLKSNNYHLKTSKLFFKNLFLKIDFKYQSKGAILVEFAFCTPVLILLIYYMHDLFKISRWHSKMEFATIQMAQMFQSVSQNRSSKKITLNDIKRVMAAAGLSIFPGTTQFPSSHSTNRFGYGPLLIVYYIKGNANGTASVVWYRRCYFATKGYTPDQCTVNGTSIDNSGHLVNVLSQVAPEQIYPKLKLKANEVKILLEYHIWYADDDVFTYYFPDGRKTSQVPDLEAFGLYLATPPHLKRTYFPTVLIFSPNPGLFDDAPPQ